MTADVEVYNILKQIVSSHLARGLPGASSILAPILRSVVQKKRPELLSAKFTMSPRWVRGFLQSEGFVKRRAKTSGKRPPDWEARIETFILQIAHQMETYNIPPKLVYAFDHMGLQIFPVHKSTFAQRGATRVSSHSA